MMPGRSLPPPNQSPAAQRWLSLRAGRRPVLATMVSRAASSRNRDPFAIASPVPLHRPSLGKSTAMTGPPVIVFTNGCFDLLHPGHVSLLERCRALGDRLIVGLNSDASIRRLKGPSRPLIPEADRAAMLRALRAVDEVILFDEPTPARLIEQIRPDVLVKGGDWPISQIVGADVVRARGGRVLSLPLEPGYSTTSLIERIRNIHQSTAASSEGASWRRAS